MGNRLHEGRVATQAGDGRHIEDAAAFARQHGVAADVLGEQEDAADVDVHPLVPAFNGVLFGRCRRRCASVVAQDVDLAQLGDRLLRQARHVSVFAAVGGNPVCRDAPITQVQRGGFQIGGLAAADPHGGAGLAQRLGDWPAQATRATGDRRGQAARVEQGFDVAGDVNTLGVLTVRDRACLMRSEERRGGKEC